MLSSVSAIKAVDTACESGDDLAKPGIRKAKSAVSVVPSGGNRWWMLPWSGCMFPNSQDETKQVPMPTLLVAKQQSSGVATLTNSTPQIIRDMSSSRACGTGTEVALQLLKEVIVDTL